MDRRRFLTFSAALAGASTWMACNVGGPFTPEDPPEHVPAIDPEEPLVTALARARALGKPLLVFVVPDDEGLEWQRGILFGSTLNRGDEALLASLALAEVVCARRAELSEAGYAERAGDPIACLIETDGVSEPTVLEADAVPALPDSVGRGRDRAYEESLQARMEALSSALVEALSGEDALRERRIAQSVASLTVHQRNDLEEELGSAEPDAELCDRAAGEVLRLAGTGRLATAEARSLLATAAAARLRVVPPFGAKWANTLGCGCDIEGEEQAGLRIACGMAFVPELGQRFLKFYV